jgi:hypothetical protein
MKLYRLIEELDTDLFNNKQIINHINPRIESYNSKEALKKVVGDLLTKIAAFSKSKDIRVTAKPFRNVILVQVIYSDQRMISEIDACFKEIHTHIKNMGGCLYITKRNNNLTTISITLLNFTASAVA